MADPAPQARPTPELVMEARLAVLNHFLRNLGITADISSMSRRKTLQKAVYLGQLTGVDLGYRFGWYLRGPYSTALAKSYYQLAEAAASGERPVGDLRESLRVRLAPVRPLMSPPQDVDLDRADWLELLASWHYLRTVRELDETAATDIIRSEKIGLFGYIKSADRALREAALLQ